MTLGGGACVVERDLSGTTLAGYRIEDRVGKGGGGTVYRAFEGGNGRLVALKVFHPELLDDDNVFRRFQREAELGMKIQHPHVVQTYATGSEEVDGVLLHWIAMEFIEGETLRDTVTELGSLPEELLYQISDQFLDALSAVHAEGMIHRDVKPENIVLTPAHDIKLMDLGVARLQQEGRDLTRAGEFVGSLAYAAPEQFLDQDHVGPRADLYAFGVLLYEMSTGHNPYDIADLGQLLARKMRGQVRRPKVVNRNLDPFLDEVILTCLQGEPDARFADCDELRRVLRERETGAWWQQRIEGDSYPAANRALRALRPPREADLAGRAAEMERLHAAYERATGGKATAVSLRGAAGIGKTRLAHDFMEELVAPEGPVLLAGRCPDSGALAYHPFREALRHYFGGRDQAHERVAALLPDQERSAQNLLSCLFDEGADFVVDEVIPAVTTIVRKLAADRPVVVLLEDLQRADGETLTLLEHLLRTLDTEPVLVAVTARDEDVEPGSDVEEALANLAQREGAQAIELGPLDEEAGDALLTELLVHGRTVRALAYPVLRTSGGNPRFLLEVLAHLKETGALTPQEDGFINAHPVREVALPADARDLIAIRVRGLDEDLRELIDAAAVIGPAFDASLLGQVTGQRKIRLLKKLALLERKHRLIESAGKNRFRFASYGLQNVLYDAIDRDRRKLLHAECADAIAEDEEKMRAQVWVRHLMRAGRIDEAGDQTAVAIEHAAMHDHGSEAVAFLDEVLVALPEDAQQLRFDTSMLLAALHGSLGNLDDQRRALARAAGEAEGMGEAGPLARVQAACSASSCKVGSYDRAESEAMKGLMLAGKAKDVECEAQCLHLLGLIAARRGEFARAADYLRDALEIRRSVGDRKGEASTLVRLGAIMSEIGEADQALETKRGALDILREIGDRRGEGAALNNVGNSLVDNDRIQEALICYEQSVKIARAFGDLPAEAAALHNVARVLTIEARIEDAQTHFERALDIFREIEDASGEAEVLDELGSAIATFGDRQRAATYLESAREAAVRHGEFPLLARVLRHLGTLRHEAGDREVAWQHFERALGLARHKTKSAILADMGAAAEREGDYERAVDLLQQSLTGADGRRRTIISLCRLARAHHQAGHREEAIACAHRAEEVIEGEHAVVPHHGPEVYYSLGTVLAAEPRGREYLQRANDLLGERTRAIRSVI
ncbi:MAG: tetratricopeptide repeat protein [Planctomycetota bacterium]